MFRLTNWLLFTTCIFGQAWAVSTTVHSSEYKANVSKVMTSIHPLALLIKSAWPEIDVDHLVPVNQSPHDFTLRPSDQGRIERSEFILWLGPELEPYLSRVLRSRHKHLALLPTATHYDNPHIWLDPESIPSILEVIQVELGLPRPHEFLLEYSHWQIAAKDQLSVLSQKGFVSYHDAFPHWVQYFGLRQLAYVTKDPDHPVGSRHLVKVRKILEEQPVACLMIEPQFSAKRVDRLTQDLNIPRVSIDPLASTHRYPDSNFIQFYKALTNAFVTCLSN